MHEYNSVLGSHTAASSGGDKSEPKGLRPGYPFIAAADAVNASLEWTPELQLMLAILEDAIACQAKSLKRPRQNPEILARQAEYWIRLEDWDSPFSFNNICEALGMSPAALRDRVLERADDAKAERLRLTIAKKSG